MRKNIWQIISGVLAIWFAFIAILKARNGDYAEAAYYMAFAAFMRIGVLPHA